MLLKQDRKIKKQKVLAYSEALFCLTDKGYDNKTFLKVLSDLDSINIACFNDFNVSSFFNKNKGSIDFANVSKDDINKFVEDSFSGIDSILIEVLKIMVQNEDMDLVYHVSKKYKELIEEKLKVLIVDVYTCVELDDNLKVLFTNKLNTDFNKNIILNEHIDKNILGGFVLYVKGYRIDYSILHYINLIKSNVYSLQK